MPELKGKLDGYRDARADAERQRGGPDGAHGRTATGGDGQRGVQGAPPKAR